MYVVKGTCNLTLKFCFLDRNLSGQVGVPAFRMRTLTIDDETEFFLLRVGSSIELGTISVAREPNIFQAGFCRGLQVGAGGRIELLGCL